MAENSTFSSIIKDQYQKYPRLRPESRGNLKRLNNQLVTKNKKDSLAESTFEVQPVENTMPDEQHDFYHEEEADQVLYSEQELKIFHKEVSNNPSYNTVTDFYKLILAKVAKKKLDLPKTRIKEKLDKLYKKLSKDTSINPNVISAMKTMQDCVNGKSFSIDNLPSQHSAIEAIRKHIEGT